MGHHTSFMMLQYMTVVHPLPGTVIRYPCDLNLASWFQVVCVFPCFVCRRFPIFFDHLEKETVQMKRMIHQAGVRHFPYLQLANVYRFIIGMHIAIDKKINSMFPAWANREPYISCYSCVLRGQVFYFSQSLRNKSY